MKKITLFIALSFLLTVCHGQVSYLLVGTYTSGKSQGIYVYHFNSTTGDFDSVSMIKTSNPSFLAVSKNEKYVYAVNEAAEKGDGGRLSAFSFDKNSGQLSLINQQPSGGDDPCYVSIDKTGKWVSVANYTSGSLAILGISPDGGLTAPQTVIQHQGKGTDTARQEGPHVHCTIFSKDNNYLLATDLGLDKVTTYPFNGKKGSLNQPAARSISTNPGAGPRHLCFHPNNKFVYLIEEMAGVISAYQYSSGKLKLIQNISALPAGYAEFFTSADIHISADGRFLYASNRDSSNTIGIFSIDAGTGELKLVGHQSTIGKTPRNFNFDPSGKFLLVADQSSDEIVIFKIDQSTGLLSDTGKRIPVGSPVCVKWAAVK